MRTFPLHWFGSSGPAEHTTAPTVSKSAAAPKHRLRRMVGLAVAAALAVVPASIAVQNVATPKAEAAVHNNWPVVGPALIRTLNFWQAGGWTATQNGQGTVFQTATGFINGGRRYNDNNRNLTNYIRWFLNDPNRQLTFREYDDSTRPSPNSGRNAGRYVYNVEFGMVFHTLDHYNNFTPLNFGHGTPAGFPRVIHCYQYGPGQNNPTRVTLHNGTSNYYTHEGFADGRMSVTYTISHQQWDRQGYYYQPSYWPARNQGFSFTPDQAFHMNHDPNAICRMWAGNGYNFGYRG